MTADEHEHDAQSGDTQFEPESVQSEIWPTIENQNDIIEKNEGKNDVDGVAVEEKTNTSEAPSTISGETFNEVLIGMKQTAGQVHNIAESSVKIYDEIRNMHKLYHEEFANRVRSMQEELERYREIEKGRIFDSILTELAKLYSDNVTVSDDITDEKVKKRLQYMFLDMLQILESNGVSKQKSEPGDKRNTRHCRVIECISTDLPELHDTVVASKSTGFYIGNRSLIKEMVHVYLYNEKTDANNLPTDAQQIISEEENVNGKSIWH